MGSSNLKLNAKRSALALLAAMALCACEPTAPKEPPNVELSPQSQSAQPLAASNAKANASRCQPYTKRRTARYATHANVAANLNSLDIYLPTGCQSDAYPVVVWIHGGGWRRGDKVSRGDSYDKEVATQRKAELANKMGAAFVAINYRLSSPGADVKWPTHATDLTDALAWLRGHAATYKLDPESLTIIGHSAGAHLTAILATDPDLMASAGMSRDDIDCALLLDTASYDLIARSDETAMVANAFGADPAVLREASPLYQAQSQRAGATRFLVVTRGDSARVKSATTFTEAIKANGGNATLLNVNPYNHDQANVMLAKPGETVLSEPATNFLQDCVATP